MEIYTLNTRDKRLLSLCLALVAFWIIFVIGAIVCLIYCVQLVGLNVENAVFYTVVFALSAVGAAAVFGAVTYTIFYCARYRCKNFTSVYDGKNFIIRGGGTTYTFTREDIVSHTKPNIARLIGKYDLSVKVRRFTVNGDIVIGAAQFTLVQLCEKSFREQTIKTFGIK